MSELLQRGYVAALAPEGVPNMDIVVTTVSGDAQFALQVKTRREIGADGGWHMRPKHEDVVGKRLFYFFVSLAVDSSRRSDLFIVPSQIVAEAVRSSHSAWLARPGAKGQQRKDSDVRRFLPDYSRSWAPDPSPYPAGWLEKYRDAWDSLPQPT